MKTYNIECDGEIHRIGLDDEGYLYALDHEDEETERIAIELGDEPSECLRLILDIEDESKGIDTWAKGHGQISRKRTNYIPFVEVMHAVASDGNFEIVRLLVDIGVPENVRDEGLWTAANVGHKSIVEYLYDAGVSDVALNEALGNAAEEGHVDIIRYLLDKGVNPEDGGSGRIPLEWAVRGGYVESVDALLKAGADPNSTYKILYWITDTYYTDEDGWTEESNKKFENANIILRKLLFFGMDAGYLIEDAKEHSRFSSQMMREWVDEYGEEYGIS